MDLILIKCSFITYLFQSRHFIYDKGLVKQTIRLIYMQI